MTKIKKMTKIKSQKNIKEMIQETIDKHNDNTTKKKEIKKDDDKIESLCECNLCYIFRNIILFLTQPLKCKHIISD